MKPRERQENDYIRRIRYRILLKSGGETENRGDVIEVKLGKCGCNLNCPKKPNRDKKKEKKGTWQAQEIIRYKYKKGTKNGGVKVKWIKH